MKSIIQEIQETSELTAEIRNQLHGCLPGHPWGKGKSFEQRKREALFAVGQSRSVDANLRYKLERVRSDDD